MKIIIWWRFAFCLLLATTFSSYLSAQVNLHDYSGSWKLNVDKSNFGEVPIKDAAANKIVITAAGDSIRLERTFMNNTSKDVLPIDGAEIERKLESNNSKAINIKCEKNKLIITTVVHVFNNGNPYKYNRTETYTLQDNKTSLSVDRIANFPDRTEIIKAFYNKMD